MLSLGTCRACGEIVDSESRFCIKCGASISDPGKCSSCGTQNSSEASYCSKCGSRLGVTPASEPKKDYSHIWSTSGSDSYSRTGYDTSCPKCGGPVLTTDWMCPSCGCNLADPAAEWTNRDGSRRSDSSFPLVIGVILLITSVLNIMNGLFVGSVSNIPAYGACGVIEVLIGIVTLPGAFAAMSKKHFAPVFIVALLTLFSVGPCFICSILGLVAVIGLAASHKEFD